MIAGRDSYITVCKQNLGMEADGLKCGMVVSLHGLLYPP